MRVYLVGELPDTQKTAIREILAEENIAAEFVASNWQQEGILISVTREATAELTQQSQEFYNWDLLFSVLGPNDTKGQIATKLEARIAVLKAVEGLSFVSLKGESHISIRVRNLAQSARFYSWLYGVKPKEWTHRYVTILNSRANLNLVLLVADDKTLHHDTLYHLGLGVENKQTVVDFYHSARSNNFTIEKPPRTTWRGTPLHELWLKDPDGTLIEIYARLSPEELAEMPDDKEPIFLV